MGNIGNQRQEDLAANKFVATTSGRNNPKQIHIAHRKSPSELTNLMIEQFTLQRQLEIVQVQQQQLLAHQQQLAQQAGHYLAPGMGGGAAGSPAGAGSMSFLPQPPQPQYNTNPGANGNKNRSHSRNNSGYYNNNDFPNPASHRRTGSQSSVYGHARRHSLGLNEAKKAAAEEQAKRAGNGSSNVSIKIDVAADISTSDSSTATAVPTSSENISTFKFPSTPLENPKGHSRATSNISPNKAFQFPPRPFNKENQDEFTAVHNSHRRTNSRGQDPPGINSNWRAQQGLQQQSQSSSFHKQSYSNQGFATLEPPPVFQPGHRSRGSNASTHSFSSTAGGNNSNGRKSLFAPYLPQANIPQLVEEGRLVAGVLRVNKKNRSDAWVSTDGVLDADIFICGSKDRNRALEGDLVAVELLMVDDVWESKKEKEEKKRRKDASIQQDLIPLDSKDDYHNDASSSIVTASAPSSSVSQSTNTSSDKGEDNAIGNFSGAIKRRGSLKQRPTQKKNDDVEVEGQSLLLVEEEEINDEYRPLYAGHVVAVLDRIPGQLFSGTLGLLRPSQQANNSDKPHKPKIVWFKPTDKKVPLIAIPIEQAPKDFVENAERYTDKMFVASIKRWPITSLHPFGTLVSQLGELNDPTAEIDAILRDNNFLSDEYLDPQNRTKERDTFKPVELSATEIGSRPFYEGAVAISENGNISDLALHVKKLSDGRIELGCHVIDVTAHIEEGSSLDRRARKRSSAVFMPQKTVYLLPQAMNEFLTFQPGKNSPTISVIYTLDANNFGVISCRICEGLVLPHMVSTYDGLNKELLKAPEKRSSFINVINSIAIKFYCERLNYEDDNNSITLSSKLALLDTLDDEKVKVDLNMLKKTPAAAVIGEIERKVNSTVAERTYIKLGASAFLRRQPSPISTKLQLFKKKVQKFGCNVDVTTPESLLGSILSIKDYSTRLGIELLLFKTLNRARYFVAGKVEPDQYGHFSLNMHLYTHFTAPLRRYADHVVHRQLKSILHGTDYKEDLDSLKITSEYCNFKKDCANHAQEQAIHLLLCKSINDMGNATGQLLIMATVLQVYESSFDVFIPELGIEKRVHGDQLPLIKAEYDSNNRILDLYWQKGVDSATFVPVDEKNPKSYRSSIRNKFSSTSKEIASVQINNKGEETSLYRGDLIAEFSKLKIEPPNLDIPSVDPSDSNPLAAYLKDVTIRREGENCIQEIRELEQVPILLRAEIGMALPCLTVRALNPFTSRE
ncbi:mRNA-binding translational repressor SSD1 Ecym_3186 [Eremothecium cymbalariae DBVPG|uniref:RNB domain-containing protein n=1 Tax=Eremothecium cymbalariae (strain CBS 270.75 / DBVPG 7215 / KCTC 17166 / NRRL Y-17582) TaxID=931890 RepID=G8JRB6_ERECY|nr:Hypothetical protein Ecym_3186 [Eremothecium cymbalariae DBVPG\